MTDRPLPPPVTDRPRVAVFYHTAAELAYVVVDRITSIVVQAPKRIAPEAVWTVRVTMGADVVERRFPVIDYREEANSIVVKAFTLAREDAIVFARELGAHVNALKETP